MHSPTSPRVRLVPILLGSAIAFLVSLLTAGCLNTPASRIRQNLELFQSLDEFSQRLVREGLVNYGFRSDVVCLALGKPNAVAVVATVNGPVETWTYLNFLYGRIVATTLLTSNGSTAGSPQLTLADSGDSPIGTLLLGFFEGRIATIRIEP